LPGQQPEGSESKGTYSITVAARYAYFKGQVMGLSITESGAPDAIERVAVNGGIHEVSAQLGVNGAW
ncbi:MAG TPA: hypothetical protein VFZ61_30845, partial [Polyangiales bacterium]